MKKKNWGIWTIILVLVMVSVPFGVWKVMAGTPPAYTIRVLEISDASRFNLKKALDNIQAKNVSVTTMRMKTFVAQRERLAGQYDLIYFAQGTYNPADPQTFKASSRNKNQQRAAHNTSDLKNDITKLKMDDVQRDYINNGLPVAFFSGISSDAKNYDPSSNLYAWYKSNKSRSNVITITSDSTDAANSDLMKLANSIKNGEARFKQRPLLDITGAPSDKVVYNAGQKLTFNFNVYNANSTFANDVNVKLYINVDRVFQSTDDNLVASTLTKQGAGSITYTVPNTYSGPLYWRMEATFAGTSTVGNNASSGLTDSRSGMFTLLNDITVIRVLQVMTNSTASSLTKVDDSNMKSRYLKDPSKGYEIKITPITFDKFMNKSVYGSLNGNYDMLLLGFADEYGRTTNSQLTPEAAEAINKFIGTGQAVMFTHDTILVNQDDTQNKWSQYFGEITGQNFLLTNLGYSNPDSSKTVKEINSGLLTEFPFDLRTGEGARPSGSDYLGSIASSHNQYYMVDLNDPNIVPWYNIYSSTRDTDDSWNHYYTYSNKNVTYSGTGHTNSGFPDWEQRLFVNTMYRAYMGSNHAPEIKLYAPVDQSTKPSYLKNLTVSYQVDDLDLNDLYVTSTVRFKQGDTYLTKSDSPELKDQKTLKGTTITRTVANPFPNGGDLTIEITATDSHGAKVVKTATLKIANAKASLDAVRSFVSGAPNDEAIRNQPVVIRYKVTPKNIELDSGLIREDEKGVDRLTISKVKFKETLPPNLEVMDPLPTGMAKSGTAASGYTLSMDMASFDYKLTGTGSSQRYEPVKSDPVEFDLTVKPLVTGFFDVKDAILEFDDLHAGGSGGLADVSPIFKDYSVLVLESSNTAGNFSAAGRAAIRSIDSMDSLSLAASPLLKESDPYTASLTIGSSFAPSQFTVNNGSVVVQGNATFRNFSINNGSLDVRGDLNLSQSTIYSGPLLVNGDLDASNLSINANAAVNGNMTMTDGSFSGNTLITGGSLKVGGRFSSGNGSSISTAGNLDIEGNTDLNGTVSFGGTYTSTNQTKIQPVQEPAKMILQKLEKAKQDWATRGVVDFHAASQTMFLLSDGYAALQDNGTTEYLYNDTQIKLTGKDPKTNVFKIDGTRMQNLNTFTIDIPAESTAIVNITGSSAKFSGGFNPDSIDPRRVLINYPEKGTLSINGIGMKASVLAPRAEVEFTNGNIKGTLVAGRLTALNGVSIGDGFFSGAAPAQPAVPGSAQFNDLPFNAVVKVEQVDIQDQTVWVGDTFQLPTIVNPEDATNRKLEWISSDPDKVSVDADGTLHALIATRDDPVIITAKSTDGSQKQDTASVTVLEPGLQISGPQSVNVGDKITLTVSASNSKFKLSDVKWTLTGSGDSTRASLNPDVTSASISGLSGGKIMVHVEGKLTNAGVSRTYPLDYPVTVINKLDSVTIDGKDWVPVGGTIELQRKVMPKDAKIAKTVWSVTDGAAGGSADVSPAANTIDPVSATLTGESSGKVTVQAAVTAAGNSALPLSGSKDIRVVELNIKGANTLFKGQTITLEAVFDTFDIKNWTGKPKDYVWTVTNVPATGHEGDAPYAELANPDSEKPSLKGNKPGTVIVTLTVGGMTETKTIQIQPKLEALQLQSPITIKVGEQLDLLNDPTRALNIVPASMSDQVIPLLIWSSSKPGIAPVSASGLVKGEHPGTTIVIVTYPSVNGFDPVTARTQINVVSPESVPDTSRY